MDKKVALDAIYTAGDIGNRIVDFLFTCKTPVPTKCQDFVDGFQRFVCQIPVGQSECVIVWIILGVEDRRVVNPMHLDKFLRSHSGDFLVARGR